MERFRELEKEFKMKPHSKRNLERIQRQGSSGSDDDDSDGSDDQDSDDQQSYDYGEEVEDQGELQEKDKEWIKEFLVDNMNTLITKLETDLDNAKSKKIKGTAKKQKEKVGMINYKLTQSKKIKDKMEELQNSLEFVEGGSLSHLKTCLLAYVGSPDEEANKTALEQELSKIMEHAETNKKIKSD